MNLLFIFTDQQNRYALSCMGNPNVDTPNLDRLAQRGVRFNRCYSNDPVCGPFRGSLITGMYTSHCGVTRNGNPLPTNGTTFPEALNNAGYTTSWVGKWHLGGNGNEPIEAHKRGGFQEFIGYQCYNGFWDGVCFYDEQNQEHCFDEHRTEVTTDIALERLDKLANQTKPFMLMMSYQAPHYPEEPAKAYAERYAGRPIYRRENCQEIDPYTPTYSPPSPKPQECDPNYQRYGNNLDEYIRLYNAMCTQIDDNIGRLLDKLESLGIADETMIVFTSDHGDMQGSHGLKNKCLPHEESAGIPLIIAGPGIPGGRVSDALVSGIDFMPTCIEMLGGQAVDTIDGQSFASLLRGETDKGCEAIFSERDSWCMMVKGEWKLVANRSIDPADPLAPSMLIHLSKDPYEMNNLLDEPQTVNIQHQLLKELTAWHLKYESWKGLS